MKYKPYPPFFQFLSVVPHGKDHFRTRKTAAPMIKGSLVDFDRVFVPGGYTPFISIEAYKVTRGEAAVALYALEDSEELLVEVNFPRSFSGARELGIFNKVKTGEFVKMLNTWEKWRYSFSDVDVPVRPADISEEAFTAACLYSLDNNDFSQRKTYSEVVAKLASDDPKSFFSKPMTSAMLLEIEGVDGEDGRDHCLTLSSPFSEFYGVANARTQELADLTLLSWKIFRKEETDETKTNAADGTGTTKPSKRRGKSMQRTEAPSNNPSGS